MKNNLANYIKDKLNEWCQDPLVLKDIQALIDARVPASTSTQEHPHIQVNKDHELGLLGILNGLIEDDSNILAANYNDENQIINFDIISSPSPTTNPLERYMQAQIELDNIREQEDALLEQMDSIWKQLSTEQMNSFNNRLKKTAPK